MNGNYISAKPDTVQVYSFNGQGGQSDLLPMKAPRKTKEAVSNYPFQFLERKINKGKFESACHEKPQTAIGGTKHTVTTTDNRILHRKHISKPIKIVSQETTPRKPQNRGKDGKFARAGKRATIEDDSSEEEQIHSPPRPLEDTEPIGTAETDTGLITVSPPKLPAFGRGRPVKLVRDRNNSGSPGPSTPNTAGQDEVSPPRLTLNADQLSIEDLNEVIRDAREASQPIQIRDQNGKANFNNSICGGEEDSEFEFNSDICSSTELEIDPGESVKTRVEGTELRRSKRLTKTNPIVRLNNPQMYDFHRKCHKRAQPDGDDNGRKRTERVNRYTANTEHRTPARSTQAPEPNPEARAEGNRFPKGGGSVACRA